MAKKILIVDDEPDVLKVAAFRLKKAGYDVLTAVNGQEALGLAKKDAPELMLLDLRLPVVSGYDVCKLIKCDEKLKNIRVILFTASTERMAEKAKEIGADGYLTKPFDSGKLLEKVKAFIG